MDQTLMAADPATLAQPYVRDALRTLVDIIRHGHKDSDRIAASRELLDRAHGRAAQAVTVTHTQRGLATMSTVQLEAALRARLRAEGRGASPLAGAPGVPASAGGPSQQKIAHGNLGSTQSNFQVAPGNLQSVKRTIGEDGIVEIRDEDVPRGTSDAPDEDPFADAFARIRAKGEAKAAKNRARKAAQLAASQDELPVGLVPPTAPGDDPFA